MAFRQVIDVPVAALTKVKAPVKGAAKKRATAPKQRPRGCEHCPSNNIPGINKIMGTVRGKNLFLWAQSPGANENELGRELVGDAGDLLWSELRRVGLRRKDFDIQNVMRCRPATVHEGSYSTYFKSRDPLKEELHCCSLYTEQALEKSKAKFMLVLGKVAALQLLGLRSKPKQNIFFDEKLGATVYMTEHPAYFLRAGKRGPKWDAFRELVKTFAADAKGKKRSSDPYAYLREQDYRLVNSTAEALAAEKIIWRYARRGIRISVDIEDDVVDEKPVIVAIGFSPKPGLAFTFVCGGHPKAKEPREVMRAARRLLEHGGVKKVMQHGCTDVVKLAGAGVIVEAYEHDTSLSEYLRFSDVKAYGLDAIAERRFPRFSGYKSIIVEDMLTAAGVPLEKAGKTAGDRYKYLDDKNLFRMSKLSLETLRLYNGGDCDLTKRIEISNKKYVPQALMSLYIDLSFLLQEMEPNGPLFDFEQHAKLSELYPHLVEKLKARAREEVGDPEFNPSSTAQVKAQLYDEDKLGLEFPFGGKPNTEKMTMIVLGRKHQFPLTILEYRSVSKVKSTYLDAYYECAKANGGRLRTRWWATGARTGRLSSGGSKQKKKHENKVINLQNIKKDAQTQNMCVADIRWRRVYAKTEELLKAYGEVDAYWQALEKWEAYSGRCRRKGKTADPARKPVLSETVQAQFARMGQRLEDWLRKTIPDFKTFLVYDYGQVEIRVAAQIAGDRQLIEDCKKSDIHTTVGVGLTGWSADLIRNDDAIRTLTKNVHFGLLFGSAKASLVAFVAGRTPPEVRDAIFAVYRQKYPRRDPEECWHNQIEKSYDRYFRRYPDVQGMIADLRDFAEKHGYVKTLFGMYQTLNISEDGHDSHGEYTADAGERDSYWGNQAINGPIQGTAHQLMICALVNLIRQRAEYKILGIPPLEVHDALYFAVNVLDLGAAYTKGKYLLEQESLNIVKSDFPDIKWQVPIEVDGKAGVRLGGKIKVDENTTPGDFLMQWFYLTRQQEKALDGELARAATP